jgi:hypothetical protein
VDVPLSSLRYRAYSRAYPEASALREMRILVRGYEVEKIGILLGHDVRSNEGLRKSHRGDPKTIEKPLGDFRDRAS